MMIDPETYYQTYLKDKSAEQIISTIRSLKNEIGRLKNSIENPNYATTQMICPSETTRIMCTRNYLERAKQAYIDVGGIYKLSKAEIRSKDFNDNIKDIDKIVLSIAISRGGNIETTVTIDKELQIETIDSSKIFPVENKKLVFTSEEKEEFLDCLKNLYIGEWRTSYSPERFGYMVEDGLQWKLEIHFSNNKKIFTSCGTNSFPYNFDRFQELLGIDISEAIDDDNE